MRNFVQTAFLVAFLAFATAALALENVGYLLVLGCLSACTLGLFWLIELDKRGRLQADRHRMAAALRFYATEWREDEVDTNTAGDGRTCRRPTNALIADEGQRAASALDSQQ